MAMWLVRAGRHGEHEQRSLDEGQIYLNWGELNRDLSKMSGKEDIRGALEEALPQAKKGAIAIGTGQVWAFVHRIEPGDLVVLPGKVHKRTIHVGEVVGSYKHDASADASYRNQRAVKWVKTDIPRSDFDQDLLAAFSSQLTICEIKKHDAEKRVRQIVREGKIHPDPDPVQDLEELARDQIAQLILANYKGHGMAHLVNAILEAQGYTTHVSPPGPDKGVDILAAPGPLGFGRPRICVQVKSSDSPVDTPTLSQLIGTMQSVQADQGLLVSWGGFKSSVIKELPGHFFRVRLWDQDDLITELLGNYDKLNETIRADLPLKRIWTVAAQEEDE